MRELSLFVESKTQDGRLCFVGRIGGIEVVLMPGSLIDQDGTPIWQLFSKEGHATHQGRRVEMLDGGCTLHFIEPVEQTKSKARRRRKGGAA